jgi:predicted HicB family RNase H-like nuclease
MTLRFSWRGYEGEAAFDPQDELYHGDVVGTRAIIHFQDAGIEGLEQAFRDSVDEYLAWAERDGFEPERPTGTDPTSISRA